MPDQIAQKWCNYSIHFIFIFSCMYFKVNMISNFCQVDKNLFVMKKTHILKMVEDALLYHSSRQVVCTITLVTWTLVWKHVKDIIVNLSSGGWVYDSRQCQHLYLNMSNRESDKSETSRGLFVWQQCCLQLHPWSILLISSQYVLHCTDKTPTE